MHPTVKPVALVADAIRDCSKRNGLVLDPFAGSGTILIAAEKTGRHAAVLELEPRYVDLVIARWQNLTGQEASRALQRGASGNVLHDFSSPELGPLGRLGDL